MTTEKKQTRLYIVGPMRGRQDFNFPQFFVAEGMLQAAEVLTCNPARVFMADGEISYMDGEAKVLHDEASILAKNTGFSPETAKDFMLYDLEQLSRCDGIAMLPGWETSQGSRVEWEFAKFSGIGISYIYPELLAEWLRQSGWGDGEKQED
jgi:hypothetical protein